jgi:hypothetical protein
VLQETIQKGVDALMTPVDGHQRWRAVEPHLSNPSQDGGSYECNSLVHLLIRDLQAICVDHSFSQIDPELVGI